MNKGKKSTLKKVLSYIGSYKWLLAASILLAAVTVALTLYFPILCGRAIDCIIGPGKVDFTGWLVNEGLYPLAKKMAVVILLTAAAQWLMNVCNNQITYQVIRDVRGEAFEKIQKLPLKYIDGHSYGDIVSRIIADVDQFADGLLMGFTQLFTGVITILGTLGFMLSINIAITILVVILTPLSLFVAKFIATRTHDMFLLQSKTRGEQTALIDEMIGNQKVVQAYGQERKVLERFDEINGRLEKCSLRAIFFSSLTNPCTRFVNNMVYAGVAILGACLAIGGGNAGGLLAFLGGAVTVGELSCLLSYANQYTKPFNEISGVITELQNALACASRIFELIEEEPQSPDPQHPAVVEHFDGSVALEHVSFSYVPGQRLIEDFNLQVKKGERVAIVGPTGCGKTTLINLLMRFYDVNSGKISVSGTDIMEMSRCNLREG